MISTPFNESERTKFRNLLLIAAQSPYEGERANALAAAERLAERHGMSLDEAAKAPTAPKKREPFMPRSRSAEARARSTEQSLWEFNIRADKARREEALREAQARGLDAEERRAAERAKNARPRTSNARRDGASHARILLTETQLPIGEVAHITGLDIYKVVGLKLKLRRAAFHGQPA